MAVHLSKNGNPACNNFTSSEIKLTENLNTVSCGSCKRTVYFASKIPFDSKRKWLES